MLGLLEYFSGSGEDDIHHYFFDFLDAQICDGEERVLDAEFGHSFDQFHTVTPLLHDFESDLLFDSMLFFLEPEFLDHLSLEVEYISVDVVDEDDTDSALDDSLDDDHILSHPATLGLSL